MTGMGASYILMITAFYVDNRPNLPIMAGIASDRLLDFTDSSRDTDLAQCTASPSLGALSIGRHAFKLATTA